MWSDWLVFCDFGFILFAFWWRRIRGLWKLPDGRDWLWGSLGLVLMSRAMLSKSLIQFSIDGWGSIPSLLFDLRQNYSGGNEDNGDLLPKVPCTHCCPQCPDPAAGRCWPTPPLETPGHSQASLGQSLWSHCSYLLGPGAHKVLFMPSRSLFPQSCVSSVIKSHLPPKSNSLGVLKAPQSRRADDPKEAII